MAPDSNGLGGPTGSQPIDDGHGKPKDAPALQPSERSFGTSFDKFGARACSTGRADARLQDEPLPMDHGGFGAKLMPLPRGWVPETDLIARAGKNDPEVVAISRGETRSVDAPPGERKEVFTYGLEHCTAVAIVSKHSDGKRSLTLSHHPPTSIDQQVREVRREILSMHRPDDGNVKHEVFIVTTGDWVQDANGEWVMDARRGEWLQSADGKWALDTTRQGQDVVGKLSGEIQKRLPGVQCKVLPYPLVMFGESSAFVLQVPAKSDEPIRYRGMRSGQCGI